jgi:hypothetical protein
MMRRSVMLIVFSTRSGRHHSLSRTLTGSNDRRLEAVAEAPNGGPDQ